MNYFKVCPMVGRFREVFTVYIYMYIWFESFGLLESVSILAPRVSSLISVNNCFRCYNTDLICFQKEHTDPTTGVLVAELVALCGQVEAQLGRLVDMAAERGEST